MPHARLADTFIDASYNRSNFLLVSSSSEQVWCLLSIVTWRACTPALHISGTTPVWNE